MSGVDLLGMKVLKPGRKQKGWSTEATCSGKGNGNGGCGAKLLVEEADLFRTSHSDYGGDTEYFTTFECSECGVLTDIQNMPGDLAQRLPDRQAWRRGHNDPRD